MFGLFKKKEGGIKVIEKIVIDETAKLKVMHEHWKENNNIVFIFWFDDSLQKAESYFTATFPEQPPLLTAREASVPQLAGRTPVFGEHYPLRSKELVLYEKLGSTSVIVFSSLNEPLFKRFGSEKIIKMMKQFGMKEDQVVEHNMISKAIHNAQGKIEDKVQIEQSAHTQKEWIEKNLPAE